MPGFCVIKYFNRLIGGLEKRCAVKKWHESCSLSYLAVIIQKNLFVPIWALGCNIKDPISVIEGTDGVFYFCTDTRFGFCRMVAGGSHGTGGQGLRSRKERGV